MGELTFRHCEAREWSERNEAIYFSKSWIKGESLTCSESKYNNLSIRFWGIDSFIF